jgi:hypothetical protein
MKDSVSQGEHDTTLHNDLVATPSNDPEKKNLNLEISLRTLLSISQLTRYMGSIYFLEETLTLYLRTTKERVLKINIGSKVNTNAITEANFKLQKDLMAFLQNQFQIIPTIQL